MIEDGRYRLYQGDCLEIMKNLKDKSIDCIICDLPYGVTSKNKWDTIIPYEPLWKEYKRIIKDNGAIILFGQDKFTAKTMLSNEKMHRYNLVWNKVLTSGFLNAGRMPLREHEDIMIFYKKSPTYNPQFTEGKPLHGMGAKFKKIKNNNNNYNDFNSCNNPSANREGDTKKYPKSILTFPRKSSSKMLHPTEKPVELLEYLIKTYSNEGDVILDNCMGSGSTGVACLKTNRDFIGIELDKGYFNMSKNRIENIS
jgi:site-specific DNA-methyltransferase (adenine-specific)|nr:site-specific DNA-methyltransferase [uncultured Terrisporobacter sp.]